MAMSRPHCWLTAALLVLLTTSFAAAQNFGQFRRQAIEQNAPPATEFVAARWRFGTNGAIGHMGWAHNYPNSDQNLNEFLERITGLDVAVNSYKIVDLGSEEVFDYPFAYVSEPGEMELSEKEVEHLREFVARGGFILVDDFDGPWQWEQMRSQVHRAFPDREFVPLPLGHPLFNMVFELKTLQRMAQYVPGGTITYFGLFNDHGELAIAAGHNNDLANFWDWYEQAQMPLEPAADAFRLGTNAVIYSMTH